MCWFSHRVELRTTELHYLFTDRYAGVAHCHAHICLLIFCVVSQQTDTFWGVGTHRWGLWPPKFELWWDFCTTHMTGKFHHPTFNRSEFIVLTNKQTDKETNRCHWKHPPCSAMLHWWVIIMDVFIWLIYLQFTNTYIESKHCLRVAYVHN